MGEKNNIITFLLLKSIIFFLRDVMQTEKNGYLLFSIFIYICN